MIGGVTDALRRGVAVNITDTLHVVRGEGRLVESDQSAGGGGSGLTDGLMGSEIEASGRLDQTNFLHDGTLSPLLFVLVVAAGRKLRSKVRAAPITSRHRQLLSHSCQLRMFLIISAGSLHLSSRPHRHHLNLQFNTKELYWHIGKYMLTCC